MRLELSRRAQTDLADVRDYSVERFGIERTIAYLDAIQQAFQRVLAYPEIGATRPILRDSVRSLSAGEHRVFYSIEADHVLILRVLHKAMDAGRHV